MDSNAKSDDPCRASQVNGSEKSSEYAGCEKNGSCRLSDSDWLMIFKLLPQKTLLETVRHVCVLWRNIADDDTIWQNIRFVNEEELELEPWLKLAGNHVKSLDLSNSILARRVADENGKYVYKEVDDEFQMLLRRLTKLQRLILHKTTAASDSGSLQVSLNQNTFYISEDKVKSNQEEEEEEEEEEEVTISQNFPDLQQLDLCGQYGLENKALEKISNNCRYLTHLNIAHCPRVFCQGIDSIAKNCQNLRHLTIDMRMFYQQRLHIIDEGDTSCPVKKRRSEHLGKGLPLDDLDALEEVDKEEGPYAMPNGWKPLIWNYGPHLRPLLIRRCHIHLIEDDNKERNKKYLTAFKSMN